jgi:hypothetical protein
MKKHILLFFILFGTINIWAQDSSKWSLHLNSQVNTKTTWSIYQENPDYPNYRRIKTNTYQYFLSQPSFRKYKANYFTEIGFRNTGISSHYSELSYIKNARTELTNVGMLQHLGSIGLFYSKNVRLLEKSHLSLWLGADINSTYSLSVAEFNALESTDDFKVRETTWSTGIALLPRLQYELGGRLIIDYSLNLQTIAYNFVSERTTFEDVSEVLNSYNRLYTLGFGMSSQLCFGFKL